MTTAYRYKFDERVDLRDAEDTLLLSVIAVEGLHGQARVRMDAAYAVDRSIPVIVVDASSSVGEDINDIFTAFLMREFGPQAFHVKAVTVVDGAFRQEAN